MKTTDQELQKIADKTVASFLNGEDDGELSTTFLKSLTKVRDAQEEDLEDLKAARVCVGDLVIAKTDLEKKLIKAEEGYQCYKRNTTNERERLEEKLGIATNELIRLQDLVGEKDFKLIEQALERMGGE